MIICRPWALAMIKVHTKFEIYMFPHYENKIENAKCKNKWFGMVKAP